MRCHGDSARGLSSKGLATAHRNIEQLTTTSYCAHASGNPSQNGIFYSIFKSSQFFIQERKLVQHPICNQSVRLCRKALRKHSCSLVLYLLCELTEIIFLNGIKSEGEGELQPGQSSTEFYRPLFGSHQPYGNYLQPQHFCLLSEEAGDVSDKLGSDFKKVFRYFVWTLNCLSAKFLQILASIIKSEAFEQDVSQS